MDGQVHHNPKLHVVLVWFRRDLRTVDNPALTAALQIAKHVVCPTGPVTCPCRLATAVLAVAVELTSACQPSVEHQKSLKMPSTFSSCAGAGVYFRS